MYFVFDTNILISAALFEGSLPQQALLRALSIGNILLSRQTQQELYAVLSRVKFARYLTIDERTEFILALTERAHWIETRSSVTLCRDPADDKFIQLALDGNAACIITGDQDLLVLHPVGNIQILAPSQFLEQYSQT